MKNKNASSYFEAFYISLSKIGKGLEGEFYPLSMSSCIEFAARHPSAADIIVCLNLLELVVTSHAA